MMNELVTSTLLFWNFFHLFKGIWQFPPPLVELLGMQYQYTIFYAIERPIRTKEYTSFRKVRIWSIDSWATVCQLVLEGTHFT